MINVLELLYGEDFEISEGLKVKNLSLREIIKMGVPNYLNAVKSITVIPWDIADILWFENGIWYEDITAFKLFKISIKQDPMMTTHLLRLVDVSPDATIDEDSFNKMLEVLSILHGVPEREVPTLTTGRFAKIKKIERMQYDRNKPKKNYFRQDINFESIVSSLAWCSPNLNITNIWDLSIFQIHDGYRRLVLKDDYDKTMMGVYTGNIDSKDINREKIHWSRILTEYINKEDNNG